MDSVLVSRKTVNVILTIAHVSLVFERKVSERIASTLVKILEFGPKLIRNCSLLHQVEILSSDLTC